MADQPSVHENRNPAMIRPGRTPFRTRPATSDLGPEHHSAATRRTPTRRTPYEAPRAGFTSEGCGTDRGRQNRSCCPTWRRSTRRGRRTSRRRVGQSHIVVTTFRQARSCRERSLPRRRSGDSLDRASAAVQVHEDVASTMRGPGDHSPVTPATHHANRFFPRESAFCYRILGPG